MRLHAVNLPPDVHAEGARRGLLPGGQPLDRGEQAGGPVDAPVAAEEAPACWAGAQAALA